MNHLAAKVLAKLLNQYIADFDASQLNLSLTGRASLRNVELRADALASVLGGDAAPLFLLHGSVGDLELSVPWQKLASKASIVVARNVVLVLGTNDGRPGAKAPDALVGAGTASLARAAALARESLDANTLTARLVTKVLANLQVRVENVSIRLVDRAASRPSSFGLLIAALRLESTDAQWKPTLASPKDVTLFKVAQIDGLAVYHDAAQPSATLPPLIAATRDALLWSSAAKAPPESVKWMLEPMSCGARVTWPLRDPAGVLRVALQCERVALFVEPHDADALVELAAHFVAYARRLDYQHLRTTTLNSAMARWRYLRECVLLRLRLRDGTLCRTWPQLLVFCKQRRQYMTLWRQHLRDPEDANVLQCLYLAESTMRPVDVRLFRELVEQSAKSRSRSRSSSSASSTPPAPAAAKVPAPPTGAKKFAAAFAARLKRNKKAPPTEVVLADEVEQLLADSTDDDNDDDNNNDAASATTTTTTTQIVVSLDVHYVSVRLFDRVANPAPLVEVVTSDASLICDLSPRAVGVCGKIQSFFVLHHRPADARFAKLIDVSARAANLASNAVVVLDCRAESPGVDFLTLLSTLDSELLSMLVLRVGLTVRPIDITLHCGVVRQLCDAFLGDTMLRCVLELLSVRMWQRPERAPTSQRLRRAREAALLGMPRLVLACTYHAPTIIVPTADMLAAVPDAALSDTVPPLLVLCFGRLSLTSPADAARSRATEQRIDVELNSMQVAFAQSAHWTDDDGSVFEIVERTDVRADVRLVGGANAGVQCSVESKQVRVRISYDAAAHAARIATDALAALFDPRSVSWKFFAAMAQSARRVTQAVRSSRPSDGEALRFVQLHLRLAALEFAVLDDASSQVVISSTCDDAAIDVGINSAASVELSVRVALKALTVRDAAEQRRHALRAPSPQLCSDNDVSRLLHVASDDAAASAVTLTFSQRRAEPAALLVQLCQVDFCVNRETVLFVYQFVERLLARFGSSASTLLVDLQSLSAAVAEPEATPPPLEFKVAVGAVQTLLHDRGLPLCVVQLRSCAVKGEQAASGALALLVTVASAAVDNKATSGPNFATLVARCVDGDAVQLTVKVAADQSTVIDVEVRNASATLLASFAASVAQWCTEFLEMRELLSRVSKRLTRALLERPVVAPPLRYSVSLADTAVIVPRDSASRDDVLRLSVPLCRVSNRLFDEPVDGVAHSYEAIDIAVNDVSVTAASASAPAGYLRVVTQRSVVVSLTHPSQSPLPLRCSVTLGAAPDSLNATVSVRLLEQLLDIMDGNLSETPPLLLKFVPPHLTVPLPRAVSGLRDAERQRASPSLDVTMAELNHHETQLMIDLSLVLPRVSLVVVSDGDAAPRKLISVAVRDVSLDVVKHSNDSVGVNFRASRLSVHDNGVSGDGRAPPAPFDCIVDVPPSSAASDLPPVALRFFRGGSGAHELHVRVRDLSARVTPRTVAALQARFGAVGVRAADTIPRVKTFHFGPELHLQDVFIVRLDNPLLTVSPSADESDSTCFVLGVKGVALQTKLNNADAFDDDEKDLVGEHEQQITVLASAEDIEIMRCTQRSLTHVRAAGGAGDAVAIVQPFDLLVDLALRQPRSLFRPLHELDGDAGAPWPHLQRTTTGHVSLQRSRQRVDDSVETIVFALSRVELWALERLAKEFERQLAAAPRAAATPAAVAAPALDNSVGVGACVRLQLRDTFELDLSSRDSVSIKLVAEFETSHSTALRTSVNADVETAAALAQAVESAAADAADERDSSVGPLWQEAQRRYARRAESNYMAIGKVSLGSLLLHVAQSNVTPARLVGTMRGTAVDAARGGVAREWLEALVCATLTCRHYNRAVCRWDSAIEPWSFQLKTQVGDGRLRSLTLHSDSVLQVNVTSALVSFAHVAMREVNQHSAGAAASDVVAAAAPPAQASTPATPRRRATTLYAEPVAAAATPVKNAAATTRSPAYTIHNDTGEDVWFWLGSEGEVSKLSTGEHAALLYEETRDTLSLQFTGSRTLSGLTVNKIGVYVLNPFPNSKVDDDDAAAAAELAEFEAGADVGVEDHIVVVYEISAANGTKRIVLRSNVAIENDCDVPLDLCVEPPRRAGHGRSAGMVLAPQGRWMVPCRYATCGALSVRPSVSDGGRAVGMCGRRIVLSRLAASEEVVRCDRVGDATQPLFLIANVQTLTELDPTRRPRVALDPRSAHKRDSAASELLVAFDVGYLGDHVVTFRPPLRLRNRLPTDARVRLRSDGATVALQRRIVLEDVVAPAEQRTVYSIASLLTATLELRLGDYVWSSAASLSGSRAAAASGGTTASTADSPMNVSSSSVEQLVCQHRTDKGHTLTLFADVEVRGTARIVSLYARWWLVNRVGQALRFRTESKRVLPAESSMSLDYARAMGGRVDEADVLASSRITLFSNRRVAVALGKARDHWSSVVDLDAVASVGGLEIERRGYVDGGSGRLEALCELGLQLQPAPGIFWRSKVLTFVPRFVLVNRFGEPLVYIQDFAADGALSGADVPVDGAGGGQPRINPHHPLVIDTNEQRAVHWEDADAPRRLRFATLKMIDRGAWSGAVALNSSVDIVLRLRRAEARADARQLRLLDVRFHLDGATTYVIVCAHDSAADGSVRAPPYNIDNRTALPIVVQQADCSAGLRDDVPPHSVIPWAWDEPLALENRRLLARLPGSDQLYELPLDSVAHHASIPVRIAGGDGDGRAVVNIHTRLIDGVRTLVFDGDDVRDEWQLLGGDGGGGGADEVQLEIALRLPELHVSLIDSTPSELLNLALVESDLQLTVTGASEALSLSIERLQIDNMHRGSPCEVLLWPGKTAAAPLRDVSGAQGDVASGPVSAAASSLSARVKPFAQLSIDRVRSRKHGEPLRRSLHIAVAGERDDGGDAAAPPATAGGDVVHYRLVMLEVQPFNVSVDSAFLLRLADFVSGELLPALDRSLLGASLALAPRAAVRFVTRDVALDDATLARVTARKLASMVYCEATEFQPIKARISYRTVPGTTTHLKERLSVVFGTLSQFGLVNIYQSPVTLRGLRVEHALMSVADFARDVGRHYLEQAIGQAAYVLGSSAALGNPVKFVGDVSAGIRDFIVEPAHGATLGPLQFASGVGKGTASLFRNITQGVSASAFAVGDSLGTGVAALSLDRQYVHARRQRALDRPANVATGFLHGLRDFSGGLYSGVTGVLAQPILGAQRNGLAGFVRGVGVGVIGVVVKPVVGVVDLATRTTEGLRNMSDDNVGRRVRVPRGFDSDGSVLPLGALVSANRGGAAGAAAASDELAALAPHVLQQFQLPATERLYSYHQCSLVESVFFHSGYLYVFEQHLCFVGLLRVNRKCISLMSVTGVYKRSIFGLDTRIEVVATPERGAEAQSSWFVSLTQRDEIYRAVQARWSAVASTSCFETTTNHERER
jgi:hypothetical protein